MAALSEIRGGVGAGGGAEVALVVASGALAESTLATAGARDSEGGAFDLAGLRAKAGATLS